MFGQPSSAPEFRHGFIRAASSMEHPILYGTLCAFAFVLMFYGMRGTASRTAHCIMCAFGCGLAMSSAPLLSLSVGIGIIIYDYILRSYAWRAFCAGPGSARLQISCEAATAQVHLQRAHHDAIMLGIGSVLADDPLLTVRLPGMAERSPIRVMLDTHLRLPLASQLVRTAREVPVWVVAAEAAPVAPERALVAAGVEVMRVSRGADGAIDLAEALQLLGTRGHHPRLLGRRSDCRRAAGAAGLLDEIDRLDLAEPRSAPQGVVASAPALRAAGRRRPVPPRIETGLIGQDRFEHFVGRTLMFTGIVTAIGAVVEAERQAPEPEAARHRMPL